MKSLNFADAASNVQHACTRMPTCSEMVRWLGAKAEGLGVDIFPGFAAKGLLLDGKGAVAGVATSDFGVSKTWVATLCVWQCRPV